MVYKNILPIISVLLATVDARFGQEDAVQATIAAVTGGAAGQAATLAGQSISTLLAGANACDKLSLADQIAAIGSTSAVSAAQKLVQAEKNFNPFATSNPSICSDTTLPATDSLRGILPLIDPAVTGAAAVNTASTASLTTPLDATGKSVADLLTGVGFTNFTSQAAGASASAAPASGAPASSAASPVAPASPTGAAQASGTSLVPVASGSGTTGSTSAATSQNLQTFTGSVGAAPVAITNSGNADRPFDVNGDTFVNFAAAAQRTCDVQFNACANVANGGSATVSVSDCTTQKTACQAAQDSAAVTSFTKRGIALSPRAAFDNLQTFTGAVGSAPVAITNSGNADRPFDVNGDTFVNFAAAAQRSCDVQFNACANVANGGSATVSVSDCTTQKTACQAAQNSAAVTSFTKRGIRPFALTPRASDNLQTFTGAVGAAPVAITNSGNADRQFEVNGDTFVNFAAAAQRSCDVQFNACANVANGGSATVSVGDCTTQKTACQAAQNSASVTSFTKRSVRKWRA